MEPKRGSHEKLHHSTKSDDDDDDDDDQQIQHLLEILNPWVLAPRPAATRASRATPIPLGANNASKEE